jgi:GTP cyclohydrolase II
VTAEKGQLDVARALAALAGAGVGPLRLVLIGDAGCDPAYRQAVERAAEGIELEFTGCLSPEGVASRLQRARLFVSGSIFESYGMAVAEAAATGVPVVGYRVGEMDRWVREGVNGFLVEPGDTGALTELIGRLLSREGRLEQLRGHGQKLFFPSWEYTFTRFLRACRGKSPNGAGEGPTLYSTCDLPTRYGTFQVKVYRHADDEETILIQLGDLTVGPPPFVRVHSECFTGEILHSLKCDCRLQLELAMEAIAAQERGAIVYLRQEGRGIGLGNKIRAYAEQAKGADTVEANERLGFPADLREFRTAAAILKLEGVHAVHLNTNNPDKVTSLEAHGITVESVVPSMTDTNPHNVDYLRTKARALGHAGLEDALEGLEPDPADGR